MIQLKTDRIMQCKERTENEDERFNGGRESKRVFCEKKSDILHTMKNIVFIYAVQRLIKLNCNTYFKFTLLVCSTFFVFRFISQTGRYSSHEDAIIRNFCAKYFVLIVSSSLSPVDFSSKMYLHLVLTKLNPSLRLIESHSR